MNTTAKILLVALLLPTFAIPTVYAQGTTIDISGISVTSLAIVLSVSAFGGLIRILIPFLRKAKDRHVIIEAAEERGEKSTIRPLRFQRSYIYTWLLALPIAAIEAILWSTTLGVSDNTLALAINAFHAGLTMTWFVAEAQT